MKLKLCVLLYCTRYVWWGRNFFFLVEKIFVITILLVGGFMPFKEPQ